MKLTHLTLRNFRSYESAELSFASGVNVISGINGSGKSNLAEAIYYLSLAKSWRTNEESALIRYGQSGASITASVEESGLTRHLQIDLSPEGKKIALNGKPLRRLSELAKLVNVVLFSPEDVDLFKGSPSERRNFLDVALSKRSLDYFTLIGKHNHLLEERNALLKKDHPDRTLLDVLTQRLIETGGPLEAYRRLYVEELNKVLSSLASALYGHQKAAFLAFRPFVKGGDYALEAKKAFERSLESDLYHKVTSVGLQREDFSLLLDEKDIALYGSQGENRLAAIALKLAPYFLIEEAEKKPIAVLDDVYSELDEEHAAALTQLIQSLGQSFVTAAKLSIDGASYYDVADHKVLRRI